MHRKGVSLVVRVTNVMYAFSYIPLRESVGYQSANQALAVGAGAEAEYCLL